MFTLRVTDAAGLHAEDTVTVTVTLVSEVSISAASNYAAEGDEAVFRLTRAGSARAALTVPVTVEETGAMLGTAAPADATFAAGARETELRVPTAADAAQETDSRVTARLASGSGWQLADGAATASVTVLDDDAAPVTETAAADVTIWSADMTVVEYSSRSIGAGSADLFSDQMGRAGLRAKYLWYDPSERVLRLGFDAGLYDAEPLTLHVGDVSLGFPENPGGDASFTLEGVGLSWTDGETLEARITKPSASAVSTDATLASLGVEGATLSPAFDARVLLYWAVADAGAETVSVSAQANDDGATVAYGPAADADAELADPQVAAPTGGEILVVVTVTAADGTVRRYRVVLAPTAAESNTAPTGAPTISGTPQVEQTLAANTSSITDEDGLTNVTFEYQWLAGGTDIAGATGSSYLLTSSEQGQTIQVRVTFTDDADNEETLTSVATVPVAAAPNREATGAPTISGTPQVGETLTADTSAIADENGLDDVSYSYQWIASDGNSDTVIEEATGPTYIPSVSDVGKTITVRVTFTDDADNQESLTSVATTAVTRPPPQASEMDGISIHDGMLRVSGGRVQLSDSSVPAADVGSYISSFKVQWKSGSQEYDATRQAVLAPEPVTANVAYYAFMPSHDVTGLTNDVEYTVRVMATNAGGDGPPSQEQTATPGARSEQLRQYIEDEIVEEHEASHPWLRQTWNYLQNNNIPLNVWNSDWWPKSTYFDNSSGIGARYVRSLNFSEVTVGAAEAEKKETILINLADIYTMTNGVSSSPAPLGIAHIYFRTVDTLSLSGCWDSRLYLDVVVSLVTHDNLAGASDWNRCIARSEDATALAVVRSALSGQTPDWFADTYHDSDGNPDLEQFWVGVQLVNSEVVAYRLRNSFGGYCDADPNWGLRITRSLNRSLASAGFDTLVNPWRDGGCVPSAPISLTASLEEDGTASVSWEAPESNGGVLLSGYKIQWQSVDAEEGTTPQIKHVYFDDYSDEARPTQVSETIDGLTEGVDYTVRVLAYNPNGDGTAAEVTVPEPNAAPTGLPTISGTPQVEQTLNANTSSIDDGDGLDSVSYSYQWIRSDNGADNDIAGETDSTYTLVLADLGKTIKVQVRFTDDADNDETLTSEATVAVAATVPSAPQSMTVTSGSQTQELDVSWQAPSSNGGSAVTGYKVQWKESAGNWDTETDVSETTVTGTTHTITSLTGGVEYAVRVIATNVAGDGPASTEARATPADSPTSGEEGTETGESDSTAAWTATLTVEVSGSGSEAVWGYSWFLNGMGTLDKRTYNEGDQTIEVMAILMSNGFVAFNVRPHPSADFVLTVDGTEFASADASEVKSQALISYVWATTLDWAEDDRVALSLTLKDTDSAEQSEPAENTPAAGLPTISGTPQVGQDLTADTSAISDEDGLDNVDYSYQWIAGGTDIAGATGSSYTLTSSEQGQTIQVRVTFTDDADNAESLTSVATETVAAKPNTAPTGLPTVSGTPQAGQTLTADTSAIADGDGLTNVSYTYQWIAGGSDIAGATGSTHTLTASEQGQTIQVRVTFTDDADNAESLTSEATVAVAQAPALLTVSLENAAASHNGTDVFTFEIRFSEQFGLSYKTLRDHAFTVVGGEVKGAQRMDRDSDTPNIRWLITVEPDGNGDVTITLPATTDCNADGAVCTADGRKLSNRLEFTVSGPGQ